MTAPARTTVMPDFCAPQRGVRQDVDAALATLKALDVPLERIRIERIGGGWPPRTVVQQQPLPGTTLGATTRIVLSISSPSPVDALPFAMRHERDGVFGVAELMPVLDSPLAKLEAFVRDAGGFLELRPEDPRTAWRWIREIFALDPGAWPEERLHALARLLPALHRIAGTTDGPRVALRTVFDLPVQDTVVVPRLLPMPEGLQTRLGERNGRLGVDAVIGNGVTALAGAEVHIGPVALDVFLRHDTNAMRRYRDLLYALVLPSAILRPVEERWHVLPPERGCVIGDPANPVRLGVNARMVSLLSPSQGKSA